DLALPVFELLECHRAMLCDIEPDLVHGGDREWIKLAAAHARGAHISGAPEHVPEQRGRHRGAHRIEPAGEQHRLWTGAIRHASSLPMKHGDQGEQPPRGIEIEGDLVLEPLHQQLGAFVVKAAPAHVDRLDLARRRGADRLVIALANQEIVFDEATERRQRQMMGHHRPVVLGADIEDEPVAEDLKLEAVGSAVMPFRGERVFLHQIVDRDGALVFDVAVAGADTVLVEQDLDEALAAFRRRRGHRRLSLIATERAWAASPSASPSAIAVGPSRASCSGPHLRMEVRFMKSSTPNPEENRAERAVGSTWLEPAT